MRVASFVNYLEFEFEGTVNKNAVVLGDVDNDGQNELIMGNENGVLAVFKDEQPRPVRVATDLGMISAVAVGDVFNSGFNALVVVTGCGHCYIYDFEDELLGRSPEKQALQPTHTQRIISNVKMVLVGDVNGDGFSEVVVGLTDRVVRTYRWVAGGDLVGGRPRGKLVGLNKWELGDQIGGITFNQCRDGSPSLLVAQPGGTYFTLKVQPPGEDSQLAFDERSSELLTKMSLDYEPLASTRLRNPNIHTEICGNIRLSKVRPGSSSSEADATDTVRSQSVRLSSSETEEYCRYQKPCSSSSTTQTHQDNSVTSTHLERSKGNKAEAESTRGEKEVGQNTDIEKSKGESVKGNSDEEVNGNISVEEVKGKSGGEEVKGKNGGEETESKEKASNVVSEGEKNLHYGYALATLDGTLMLVQDGRIQWNLQVDHQLFAVCGLDVTGDGRDEVVACAWDGNTYIVCEGTDCVRFTFHHPVSAFTAGHYGLRGRQVTCLVYVSFGPRVWVYHDLNVAPVVTRTLSQVLEQDPRYHRLLHNLRLNPADSHTLRHLHHYLLYGPIR